MKIKRGIREPLVGYLWMSVLLTCLLLTSGGTEHTVCHQPFSVCLLVQFKR